MRDPHQAASLLVFRKPVRLLVKTGRRMCMRSDLGRALYNPLPDGVQISDLTSGSGFLGDMRSFYNALRNAHGGQVSAAEALWGANLRPPRRQQQQQQQQQGQAAEELVETEMAESPRGAGEGVQPGPGLFPALVPGALPFVAAAPRASTRRPAAGTLPAIGRI